MLYHKNVLNTVIDLNGFSIAIRVATSNDNHHMWPNEGMTSGWLVFYNRNSVFSL